MLGLSVGEIDGLELSFGEALGTLVGGEEVAIDGEADELFEGELVWPTTGLDDGVAVLLGDADGDADGEALGLALGDTEGDPLGDAEGDTLGLALGLTLGDTDGDVL